MRYFFILFSLSSFFSFSQNGIVKGLVLNSTNNQPIELAKVQIVDKQLGAVTNENGEFQRLPQVPYEIKEHAVKGCVYSLFLTFLGRFVIGLKLSPLAIFKYKLFPHYVAGVFLYQSFWPCWYMYNAVTKISLTECGQKVVLEFKNGLRIEIEGRRSLQFLNSILFNKMYGIPHDQKTIVDIGANKGLFAVFFAKELEHKDLKIYCYEPHPNTFQILQNNIRLNRLGSNIFAFQKVVSGTVVASQSFFIARDSFDYSVFNEYKSKEKISVENTTLPSIIDENNIVRIDLLKMNCEKKKLI